MEQVLYSLPDGWEWLNFDSLVENLDGKRIPIKTSERSKEKAIYPYYGATGIIDYVDDYIYEGEKLLISEDGANLVARKYPIAFLADGKYWVNNHAHVVDAYKDKISNKYLSYFFAVLDLSAFITGSAQPKLSQKKLNSIKIAVAPIAEQKRIVEKLDALLTRIDTAIKNLQESVALKNSLLQSALDGQFSAITERTTIESLAEVKGGKRLPKGEKLIDEVTEHPYIRVADFTDKGTIDLSGIKYISKEIHEQIKRYVISKDDLYISIAGTIGKTGFVPPELDGANLTENAAKLVIKDKQQLDLSYLYLFTLTSDFSAQAGLATKTVAQPKLALTRLSKIEIPMCSLKEQKSLVSMIEELKSKIHVAEAVLLGKIEDLKSLKASILDSAFKGEL
jgi:type I restriction enzyme S subunit